MASKALTFALTLSLAVLWAAGSSAQTARYPVTGQIGFRIGDGLPIPICGGTPPIACMNQVGEFVRQPTAAADPRTIQIDPGMFTVDRSFGLNIPVFANNDQVFQVKTFLILTWPNQPYTFAASGRTGASTVTFCPGDVVTANGNPNCNDPSEGEPSGANGLMRYTKTANQFGGPARGSVNGGAIVALRVNAGAPCDFATNGGCQVIFNGGTGIDPTPGTGAQGAPFGISVTGTPTIPDPGLFQARIAPDGLVTYITPTGLGPGTGNTAISFGGPWTTGMLTVSVTDVAGTIPEVFTLTGYDNRVNGVGTISLVAGAVADRGSSNGNSNRGWLVLTTAETTPSLSSWGLGALALVLAGVAARKIRARA